MEERECWVQQVIITTFGMRGEGKPGDPYRRVTEIWELDGTRIAEVDRWKDKQTGKHQEE